MVSRHHRGSNPDWELYFAFMDGVPPNISLQIPGETLELLQRATNIARKHGVRTVGEFAEMAIWERMEREAWGVPYDTIISTTGPLPCFFCGEPTDLIDISFEAPFCGSGTCEWAIDEDLRRLAGISPAQANKDRAPAGF